MHIPLYVSRPPRYDEVKAEGPGGPSHNLLPLAPIPPRSLPDPALPFHPRRTPCRTSHSSPQPHIRCSKKLTMRAARIFPTPTRADQRVRMVYLGDVPPSPIYLEFDKDTPNIRVGRECGAHGSGRYESPFGRMGSQYVFPNPTRIWLNRTDEHSDERCDLQAPSLIIRHLS